jgi:hypothetical protein
MRFPEFREPCGASLEDDPSGSSMLHIRCRLVEDEPEGSSSIAGVLDNLTPGPSPERRGEEE